MKKMSSTLINCDLRSKIKNSLMKLFAKSKSLVRNTVPPSITKRKKNRQTSLGKARVNHP